MPAVVVRRAQRAECARVAWLAALAFPLACPAGTTAEEAARHIADHLAPQDFERWVQSPTHEVLVALQGDQHVGYALLHLARPTEFDPVQAGARSEAAVGQHEGPWVELSKIYVHPSALGTGIASDLMRTAITTAVELAAAHGHGAPPRLWLGTNRANLRAQSFYLKHGFTVAATRTFDVGGRLHDDVVMVRQV